MKITLVILLVLTTTGCSQSLGDVELPRERPVFSKILDDRPGPPIQTMIASQYLNYNELTHRTELRKLIGVDPVRTEWCAAFVNAVLRDSGLEGSESVSNYPLTARSFLHWGNEVQEPMTGDLIVFPRGNQGWQGHVGFYFGTVEVGGITYYRVLGGNQNNQVSIELYPASKAISIRRQSSI